MNPEPMRTRPATAAASSISSLLAPALRTGWQGRFEGVHRLCGTRIDIDTRCPFPVSTDGEVTTQTPVQFEVVPAAIEVMVPPEYLTMGKKNAAQ